jgi:hypothetical protein
MQGIAPYIFPREHVTWYMGLLMMDSTSSKHSLDGKLFSKENIGHWYKVPQTPGESQG